MCFDPNQYDLWYDTRGKELYEKELSLLGEAVGGFRLGLEVGVGTGRFASPLGVQVGLDPDFGMLRIARERGVICVQGKGEALPFRDSAFDLVLIVFTLCFVEDPAGVLREARRCLKQGGRLVLGFIPSGSLKADEYEELGRKGHPIYRRARFYSIGEVRSMVEKAGLGIVEEKGVFFGERGGVWDFAILVCSPIFGKI
jgi:SAM-dependent methyltransferase